MQTWEYFAFLDTGLVLFTLFTTWYAVFGGAEFIDKHLNPKHEKKTGWYMQVLHYTVDVKDGMLPPVNVTEIYTAAMKWAAEQNNKAEQKRDEKNGGKHGDKERVPGSGGEAGGKGSAGGSKETAGGHEEEAAGGTTNYNSSERTRSA